MAKKNLQEQLADAQAKVDTAKAARGKKDNAKTQKAEADAQAKVDQINADILAEESDGQHGAEEVPAETRGRKAKEITMEDVQNKGKEFVLAIQQYINVKKAAGKNHMRLSKVQNDVNRALRTHLVD